MNDKENDKTVLEEENLENVAGGTTDWDYGFECYFTPTSVVETSKFGRTIMYCGTDPSCIRRGVACSCYLTDNCSHMRHLVDENHKPVHAIRAEWRT